MRLRKPLAVVTGQAVTHIDEDIVSAKYAERLRADTSKYTAVANVATATKKGKWVTNTMNPETPKQIRAALIEMRIDTITYMYGCLVYKTKDLYYVGIREIKMYNDVLKSLDAAVAFIYAVRYSPE